jgi:hypothetical protein
MCGVDALSELVKAAHDGFAGRHRFAKGEGVTCKPLAPVINTLLCRTITQNCPARVDHAATGSVGA